MLSEECGLKLEVALVIVVLLSLFLAVKLSVEVSGCASETADGLNFP